MKVKLLSSLYRVLPLLLLFKMFNAGAQTNPSPHNLSSSNFTFAALTASATTYPTSMQGWQTSANNISTAETTAPSGDFALSLTLPGIANNTTNGFVLQSSTSGSSLRVGSIVLALNTTGRNNILVNWTAQDLSAIIGRQANLSLQYRIGNTGNFTDLGSTYTTSTNSQKSAQNFSITLPYACTDEPLVQLRWIYYESGTASVTRDPIRLDDISVTSSAMSCVQKPSGLMVNNIESATAQVSWTASVPTPASGYDYYYSTVNTPPVDTTPPTGNTFSNSVSLTGLTANTTYYFWVRSKCGGGSQQSKWVGPLSLKTYCRPTVTTPSTLYIKEFQFVGVLNNVMANTSTYASGYQDFTSLSSIAQQPQNTALNITAKTNGSTGGSWKAWVDWNRDGDFNDAGEEIYKMVSYTTPSITFGIVIPSTALGIYRLRIGTSSSAADFLSCPSATLNAGEFEDYLFDVVTDCAAKVVSINNVNAFDGERCGPGVVRISATGNASAVNFKWYDSIYGGNLLGTGSTFNTPSISSTTTYYVTAVSAGGCETAYRYPVEARIDPNPTVTFSTSNTAICGEDVPSLLVTASGDKYQDVIYEKFDSGLGQFTNVVAGSSFAYSGVNISDWLSKASPYIPTVPPYEGLSPALSSGYFGGNYAMINSDISRTSSVLDHLVSNNFDVSGFLNLKVDFDMYHFSIASDDTQGYVNVDYSLDGGVTWANLTHFFNDVGNPFNWQKFSFNIPGGPFTSTQFKLRFTHFSKAQSSPNIFYEAITTVDNVRIYGFKTINTPFNWSSAATTLYDTDCATPIGNALKSTVCVKPTPTEKENVNWSLNASATFSNGCPALGSYTVANDTKTWSQSGITDWNLAAQWKPVNVPDIKKCVIVKTPVELPSGTLGTYGLARSVIVKSGGKLTVSPKSSLTIQNYIKNEAAVADVVIESDADLLQNNNAAVNIGNITVRRNSQLKRLDYNLWGSPVVGQNVKAFSSGTLDTRFYVYNESNDYFDGLFVRNLYPDNVTLSLTPVENKNTYNFIVGKGYGIRASNSLSSALTTVVGEFKGVPFNGIADIPLLKSTSGKGYNLIANPYPSSIDFYALYNYTYNNGANKNSNLIYNTVYFWTNTNFNPKMQGANYPSNLPNGRTIINNYAVLNGTGGLGAPYGFAGTGVNTPAAMVPVQYIKPGQGFLVKAKSSGNLRFEDGANIRTNNAMGVFFNRVSSVTSKNRYWLNLKTPLDFVTPLLVGYVNGATDNYDEDFDAELLILGGDSFYSVLEDKKLAIQGKGYPFDVNDVVPLGVRLGLDGQYEISLGAKEGVFVSQQPIYLNDKLTGTVTNLLESNYLFTANAGDFLDRFEIQYTTSQGILNTIEQKNKSTVVYQLQNEIIIQSPFIIKQVKVYDASGKLIHKSAENESSVKISSINYPKGVYIIKIETNKGLEEKKIMK